MADEAASGWWDEWKQPAVILGVATLMFVSVGWQLSGIDGRIASIEQRENTVAAGMGNLDGKIDRRSESIEARVGETNGRIDRILAGQTDIAERMAELRVDMQYVRGRLDQIAERLCGRIRRKGDEYGHP